MDFKQLRAFAYVADLGSFTRASVFLHLTQPALSRQIRLLEQELGTRLFLRTSQGITLTPDGVALMDHATSVLGRVENIKKEFAAKGTQSDATGVVSVGFPAPASRYFSENFFDEFEQRCPGLSLRVVEGFSSMIHEWLLTGSLDLAILFTPRPSKIISCEHILSERLYAIGRASDTRQTEESILFSDLAKQTLFVPHRPHVTRDQLDLGGIELSRVVEMDSLSLMLKMAASGRGYTVLPHRGVVEPIGSDLYQTDRVSESGTHPVSVRLISQPALSWEISICYSTLRSLGAGVQVTRRFIIDEMKQLVRSGLWKSATIIDR